MLVHSFFGFCLFLPVYKGSFSMQLIMFVLPTYRSHCYKWHTLLLRFVCHFLLEISTYKTAGGTYKCYHILCLIVYESDFYVSCCSFVFIVQSSERDRSLLVGLF
jgi:hypothetical protein